MICVEKIVVSFDNMQQLEEILKIRIRKLRFPDLRPRNKEILNPSTW